MFFLLRLLLFSFFFFFFNDTATTEIYTLSLHDALPICWASQQRIPTRSSTTIHFRRFQSTTRRSSRATTGMCKRSEEHTSELQSQSNLVCRLLLEKKKKNKKKTQLNSKITKNTEDTYEH